MIIELCTLLIHPQVCGKDGWGAAPDHRRQPPADVESGLLECLLCYDITHPACVSGQGELLSRLPNSWECPKCVGGAGSLPPAQ